MASFKIALFIFLIGCFLMVSGCGGDPQVKKAEHMQRGAAYVQEAKYAEAIIEYKNAVQIDPADAKAHFGLAAAILKQGNTNNFGEAFRSLQRSVQLAPDWMESHLKLGELYLVGGDFKRAQEQAQRVLESDANQIEALYLLGAAYLGQRDPDQAISALRTVLTLDPKLLKTYTTLATAYLMQNDAARAEQMYQQALDIDRQAIDIHGALALLYTTQRRFDVAEAQYRQAIAVEPTQTGLYINLARLYAKQRKLDEAEAILQEAQRQRSDHADPHVALGDFYLATQQLEKAQKSYEQARDVSPEELLPKQKLAALHLQQKQLDAAESYNEEIIQRHPEAAIGYLLRGQLALAKQALPSAIEAFQRATVVDAKLAPAHYYLGLAYLRNDQTHAAKTAFNKALELAPQFVQPRMALAGMDLQDESFDLVLEAGLSILEHQPRNAGGHLMVGIGYLGQGQVEKAIDVFKKITAGAPQLPYGHYYLGVAYQRQQQRQAALEAFEQALLLNPNFVQALNRIVAMYVREGKLDEALGRTQAHVKMLPQHPLLNDLVGKIHLVRKDPKQAEKAFQQAIAADGESLASHLHLSQLYVSQQAYDQATAQLQAAIEIDPYQVSPHMMLGMVHDQRGNHEQAQSAYEKVLEINPNVAAAANNLAWNYAEHGGNFNVALTLAQKAKEASPDDPRIADTLGWIYYKKQLYAKAISELKDSAKQLPNDPVVHYHLGMAYFQNGDQDQAKIVLQRALDLQDHFDGADHAKQILTALHQD